MKNSMRVPIGLALVVCFGLLSGFVGKPREAPNGNNDLKASYNFTLQGDVTAAGIGMRGRGTGEIAVADVPAGATVHRAFLYWATLGNVNTYTSPTLEGQAVDGDLIGRSTDTCWGAQNNFVYRADVTSLVDGNGTYSIAGLPNDLTKGNDTQGASLVVLYADEREPFRTIVINDGAVSLDLSVHFFTDIVEGYRPDDPVSEAKVTYLIGDGQAKWDEGSVSFNGEPIAAGVFSGIDGKDWGTHTFDVTGLAGDAPASTTINNHDPQNPDSPDCLLWAGTIFSVTTDEPDEGTNDLSRFTTFRLFGDVVSDGTGLRGTGQGQIEISGIPRNARVEQALLYWATIGNSSNYTSPELSGRDVDGQLIGVSADTCWGALHNHVYRADVTPLVQGNGIYTVAELPFDLAAGNDSQGASLVVIYSVPGLYRTIIVHDGAVTLDLEDNSYTDTLTGFTADQPNAQAYVTYVVGDGQSRWVSGNVSFEGTSIANNVFNGVDGNDWGTLTFDVSGLISEPRATATISNNVPGEPESPDCLLWAATILSVETEQPN